MHNPLRPAVLGLVLSYLVLQPVPAMAEGKIRELLRERIQERAMQGDGGSKSLGAGFDDGSGGGSCAERDSDIQKKLKSPLGKRIMGPKPDLADLSYGTHSRQKLDVFLPKTKAKSPIAPIIIMVHGGGWCTGDKAINNITENKVARWVPKGFIFVSINYPMVTDGYDALAQVDETARAVAYVQKSAAQWGGDGSKIILMGHSAGAHLISMVNADPDTRRKFNIKPLLGAVSLDAGAIDVVTQMPNVVPILKTRYKEAFGTDEAIWIAASPYHQLAKPAAPWLGVCSSTRPDNPCGQADAYVKKSKSLGIMASSLPLAKGHGALNKELGLNNDYTKSVEKFMAALDPVVKRLLGV